jgi:hypothetical protein
MASEVIPARVFGFAFLEAIPPGLAHREGLWSRASVKKMLCGIIRRNSWTKMTAPKKLFSVTRFSETC